MTILNDYSTSDTDTERKKRKTKKALDDLAAVLMKTESKGDAEHKLDSRPEPVPPPHSLYESNYAEDTGIGKWRPMALKVKLGGAEDEPEVEESRMVYMKEDRRMEPEVVVPQYEEEELPPGNSK